MKPTTINTSPSLLNRKLPKGTVPAIPIKTGAIVLNETQVLEAEKALAALDFATMQSGDVIRIGLEAEKSLQLTLDGFPARLDKNSAAAVFALFGRLEQGVEDADLLECWFPHGTEPPNRPGSARKPTISPNRQNSDHSWATLPPPTRLRTGERDCAPLKLSTAIRAAVCRKASVWPAAVPRLN